MPKLQAVDEISRMHSRLPKPELKRFRDRASVRPRLISEVCDCASDTKNAADCSCRELHAADGASKERDRFRVGIDQGIDLAVLDCRVASDAAFSLSLSRAKDPLTDDRTALSRRGRLHSLPADGTYSDVEIDSVQQGTRELSAIPGKRCIITATIVIRRAVVAAWAGVGCGDQLEASRQFASRIRARDPYHALFENLTQGLKASSVEFGQLVEEQHAVVCERYFTRSNRAASAQ